MTEGETVVDASSDVNRSARKSCRRRMLEGSVLLISVGSLLVFLLGRLGPSGLEALASPWTLQISIVMSMGIGSLFLLGRRAPAVAMLPGLAWAWWVVVPVLTTSPAASDGPFLRIVSFNVGVTSPPDAAAIEWLASSHADLIGLLECTPEWVDAVEGIEREDGRRWSTIISRPRSSDVGGIALFGLDPLRDDRIATPVDGGLPQLEATATTALGSLRILLVHPIPPLGGRMTEVRDATFEWIADRCEASPVPALVVGDLNETPFGRTFQDFTAATGLRGAGGWSPTWPVRLRGITIPSPFRIPIDHVLVPEGFGVRTHRVGPDFDSDHRPVVVDVIRTST